MAQAVAVTKAIPDLNEAHERFSLIPVADPAFFAEWQAPLPALSEAEKVALDRYRDRYLYYAADGSISEGTVNVILVSPLLELLGLCDPPFKIRGEQPISIALEDEDILLQGRIDALVIQNQLWVVVVEAKSFGFSVLQALPQTLAYLMGCPHPDRPAFALITTGEDYLFVKLDRQNGNRYARSYKFTLLSDENSNLYRVARVLKRIAGVMAATGDR